MINTERINTIKKDIQGLCSKKLFVLFLYIFVIFCVNFPILCDNATYTSGDGIMGYLRKIFFIDGIKQGEFPLWNPYTSIGTPYLADIRQTTFSIFNILYFFFDSTFAFNLTRILQLIMAAFFMYLLVREMCKNDIVAIMSGFIFAFSVMLGGIRVNHTSIIPTIAFFPVVFFFLEKFHKTRKESWILVASIIMALQFLCGFTQTVLYFDILAFVYYVYIVFDNKYQIRKAIWLCAKWIGLYILLICVQLLPTAQLMLQSGREDITWDYFSILSYDLRILFMMITPYAGKSMNYAFSSSQTSGVDVEIYIGVILLTYLIYEIVYQIRNRQVKVLVGMLFATFIFGMAANVPFLGKVIYNTPILGSFRICARSLHLSLFVAIILVGLALANFNDSIERKRMKKIAISITLIVLGCYIGSLCIFSQESIATNIDLEYQSNLKNGLLVAFGLCVFNIVGLWFLEHIASKKVVEIIMVCLCVVSIADVMRFSNKLDSQVRPVDEILDNKVSEEISDFITQNTDECYRTFAVASIDKNSYPYGLLYVNRDYFYNSYLTFIDKKFEYWDLDETFSYPKLTNQLVDNDSLISMLGIHCLIDSGNHELDGWESTGQIVYENETIEFSEYEDIMAVVEKANWLQENSTYKIVVEVSDSGERPELFYADFCGEAYDNAEQDGILSKNEKGQYETFISITDLPQTDIYFRIIASKSDCVISSVSIEKLNKKTIYEEIASDEKNKLYINPNAQKIVYIPEEVKRIDSFGENWQTDGLVNVDRISYVEDIEQDIKIDNGNSKVVCIDVKRNSVLAVIKTDKETFVNHSQLAYPGWKAYVDGEEVKLYTVNNLIQGIIVPAGEHTIKFSYQPDDVKYGTVLTILGIILTVILLALDNRKNK